MKISGLIQELEELQKLRGDIDVYTWPRPLECECGVERMSDHDLLDVPEVREAKYPGDPRDAFRGGGATIAIVEAS